MTQQNGNKREGPPCPKIERLEELIDELTSMKLGPQNGPLIDHSAQQRDEMLQEVIEALDWTHTMLSNRKVYQKKQQIGKKAYIEIAKKLLSPDELAEIKREADRRLAQAVADGE